MMVQVIRIMVATLIPTFVKVRISGDIVSRVTIGLEKLRKELSR